jgi:hypothetical protein
MYQTMYQALHQACNNSSDSCSGKSEIATTRSPSVPKSRSGRSAAYNGISKKAPDDSKKWENNGGETKRDCRRIVEENGGEGGICGDAGCF